VGICSGMITSTLEIRNAIHQFNTPKSKMVRIWPGGSRQNTQTKHFKTTNLANYLMKITDNNQGSNKEYFSVLLKNKK